MSESINLRCSLLISLIESSVFKSNHPIIYVFDQKGIFILTLLPIQYPYEVAETLTDRSFWLKHIKIIKGVACISEVEN